MKLRIVDRAAVNPLEAISGELLTEDLARFHETLADALLPQQAYLTDAERDLYTKGKKIRPIMLLLSARMVHGPEGDLPEAVIRSAASVEMLHVASLIHDDIIDGADTRRGVDTINARRGTAAALLIGDMQFLSAIRGFTDAIQSEKDMTLVKMALTTSFKICCGELDELDTRVNADAAAMKRRYLETIERKTAILFGFACEAGIMTAGGDTADARRGGFFGRNLGRAFQIMDDLFDVLQDKNEAGKAQGSDLVNGRLSLPLIYALPDLDEQSALKRDMAEGRAVTGDRLFAAIDELRRTKGIEKAYADACAYGHDALSYLSHFTPNRYRSALRDIALYIIHRV